jgi:hypothetical protein
LRAGTVQENKDMKQLTLPTDKSLIYNVLWTVGQGGQGKNANRDSRLRFLGLLAAFATLVAGSSCFARGNSSPPH